MLFVQFTTSHRTVSPTTGSTIGLDRATEAITISVDIANNGGDDVASCDGGSFTVFVFAFFGDDIQGDRLAVMILIPFADMARNGSHVVRCFEGRAPSF